MHVKCLLFCDYIVLQHKFCQMIRSFAKINAPHLRSGASSWRTFNQLYSWVGGGPVNHKVYAGCVPKDTYSKGFDVPRHFSASGNGIIRSTSKRSLSANTFHDTLTNTAVEQEQDARKKLLRTMMKRVWPSDLASGT